MKKKTLAMFEETHGGSKIKELKRKLEVERRKVESLADVQGVVKVVKTKETTLKFAVTGDRHAGSLYYRPANLEAFYDYAVSQGVECVYDVGDFLDGHRCYKGQEFELRDLGLEAQLARAASMPRTIETRFITGNHDATFKHLAGVPVGKLLAGTLPGYKFLGEEQARVTYSTPNGDYTLMLLHPGGGSAYALSYRPQKIIESLDGGTKPNMLFIGHYHKAEFLPSYRNVACLQAGTFQAQTPFMARGGLAAHMGGWVVEVCVGTDVNTVKAEFAAFYE